jgi:hypothetical protein
MPIDGEWWSFTLNLVEMEKDAPGVFELGNPGKNVIFIEGAPKVRARLLEHLEESSSSCITRYATRYRVQYTANYRKRQEELFQHHTRLHGKMPRCNERFQ